MKQNQVLPDEYCPWCAKERPEEFAFIHEAEESGAIIFTATCAKHAVEFLRAQPGFNNVRVESDRARMEIGGRTFVSKSLLPATGMGFRKEAVCR